MPIIDDLCKDLADEHASLDDIVSDLDEAGWSTPTPATGWDVRDTISHLTFFDEQATLAIDDPPAFEEHKATLIAAATAGEEPDVSIGRLIGSSALLDRWRGSRNALIRRTLLAVEEGTGSGPERSSGAPPRVAWYGPPMSLASFISARIMETWAHGADVRDALGVPLEASVTGRLRHLCHLAYGARAFTFAAHGVQDPGDPVSMVVGAPDGGTWAWGPPASEVSNVITGSALDIALVFTQRRHPSRTAVQATGPTAELWLSIAQAFAGPPTITAEDR